MRKIENLASAWAEAWTNDDTEAFVALFTKDAVYRDDQAGRVSRGHDELREFHSHFAKAISNRHFEFQKIFQCGDDACLEWVFSGLQSGSFHGAPPSNAAFQSPGVSVITLANDGRVKACVDYYDSAALQAQLAVKT